MTEEEVDGSIDSDPPITNSSMAERLVNVMQVVSQNARKNVETLVSLHALATTRSLQHLIGAIISMIVLSVLLYTAMLRIEQRAIKQWSALMDKLNSVPSETAKQMSFQQHQSIRVEQAGKEDPITTLAREHMKAKEDK